MSTSSQQTIVLKVGTYVLQQPNGKLDYNLIQELAKTIAELRQRGHEVLLVSSGAIGAGRERCTVLPKPSASSRHQVRVVKNWAFNKCWRLLVKFA
jgi:glutamate 5-kinase